MYWLSGIRLILIKLKITYTLLFVCHLLLHQNIYLLCFKKSDIPLKYLSVDDLADKSD